MNHPALRVAGYYLGVCCWKRNNAAGSLAVGGCCGRGCGVGLVLVDASVVFLGVMAKRSAKIWPGGSAGAELGRGICWRLGIFLLGWANYAGQTTPSSPNDLRHWVPDAGAIAGRKARFFPCHGFKGRPRARVFKSRWSSNAPKPTGMESGSWTGDGVGYEFLERNYFKRETDNGGWRLGTASPAVAPASLIANNNWQGRLSIMNCKLTRSRNGR